MLLAALLIAYIAFFTRFVWPVKPKPGPMHSLPCWQEATDLGPLFPYGLQPIAPRSYAPYLGEGTLASHPCREVWPIPIGPHNAITACPPGPRAARPFPRGWGGPGIPPPLIPKRPQSSRSIPRFL